MTFRSGEFCPRRGLKLQEGPRAIMSSFVQQSFVMFLFPTHALHCIIESWWYEIWRRRAANHAISACKLPAVCRSVAQVKTRYYQPMITSVRRCVYTSCDRHTVTWTISQSLHQFMRRMISVICSWYDNAVYKFTFHISQISTNDPMTLKL